jgi:hypothetical protein
MGLRNFIQRATPDELLEQLQELQRRLAETQETLRALQNGEADAIVVATGDGHRVYSLKGTEQAYRLWIQSMAEGALTLNSDGLILFANRQFAAMAGTPLDRVPVLPSLTSLPPKRKRRFPGHWRAPRRDVPARSFMCCGRTGIAYPSTCPSSASNWTAWHASACWSPTSQSEKQPNMRCARARHGSAPAPMKSPPSWTPFRSRW